MAVIVEVIKIVNGFTITRVVGIRLPVRGGFVMLAACGFGGRVMAAEEVASTEDANRELLAGSVGAGGVKFTMNSQPMTQCGYNSTPDTGPA